MSWEPVEPVDDERELFKHAIGVKNTKSELVFSDYARRFVGFYCVGMCYTMSVFILIIFIKEFMYYRGNDVILDILFRWNPKAHFAKPALPRIEEEIRRREELIRRIKERKKREEAAKQKKAEEKKRRKEEREFRRNLAIAADERNAIELAELQELNIKGISIASVMREESSRFRRV